MFGYIYTEIITRCFNGISGGYQYWIKIPQYFNNKIIFKGTKTNIKLAIIISFRHFLLDDGFMTNYKTTERRAITRYLLQGSIWDTINNSGPKKDDIFFNLSQLSSAFNESTLLNAFIQYNFSTIIKNPFSHAHRFVYRNQFFWLALFLLINIYDLVQNTKRID